MGTVFCQNSYFVKYLGKLAVVYWTIIVHSACSTATVRYHKTLIDATTVYYSAVRCVVTGSGTFLLAEKNLSITSSVERIIKF